MRNKCVFLLQVALLCFPLLLNAAAIRVVEINGTIGPASAELVKSALKIAEQQNEQLIVLLLDTPGGLSDSTRKIVNSILLSEIPVVTFVSPEGARAASAGTYILYASDIAAMAPTTHVGAATPAKFNLPLPISIGDKDAKSNGETTKTINDAVAYIKGLAEKRGRNVDWAEASVRQGATLTATQALDKNVVEFLASDLSDLLMQIESSAREIKGKPLILGEAYQLEYTKPDWRQQWLAWITNPNIAYLLMLLGIYGIIFELSSPGMLLPGVAGAVALMLALYAFQLLAVNYAGLALTILGVTFILLEVFVSSAGILGTGGVVAFVAGSVMLFDDDYLDISLPLIGGIALIAAVFMYWIITMLLKARREKPVSGREAMLGAEARVIDWSNKSGRVNFGGESWLATSEFPLTAGQQVKIIQIEALNLIVEPV